MQLHCFVGSLSCLAAVLEAEVVKLGQAVAAAKADYDTAAAHLDALRQR